MPKIAVIGSGFASLAAACVLAQRGYGVTVVEKNADLGGRARHFTAAGLSFDMGPSWYWMPGVFDDFFALFGKKVEDYYHLCRLDPPFSMYFGPGQTLHVPDSPQALSHLFEELEPGSSARLERFLREAAYKYETGMGRLVFQPGRSLLEFADWSVARGLARMHLFQSFHRYVRKFFRHPWLIQLLEFPILFLGGMPANTPALYSLMNHAELVLGTWYPMGGMRRIVEAMVQLADSLGVEFVTGTPVTRIHVEDGLARGLETESRFFAADAVIAGADYHHVEQSLLEKPYRRYSPRYWHSRVMAPSSLLFYLGIDGQLDGIGHHTLFFDEDFANHAEALYRQPHWPNRPLFYACCPSKTDPSVAPAGKENLFLLIPVAAGLEERDGLADAYLKEALGRVGQFCGQDLSGRVFYRRDYSVRDFSADYNAYKGNAYGLANTLRQTALLKPSLVSPKVGNLYFAGQLTLPGPGVPPSLISGQIAARQAIDRLEGGK
jgi:phytoene desaturase